MLIHVWHWIYSIIFRFLFVIFSYTYRWVCVWYDDIVSICMCSLSPLTECIYFSNKTPIICYYYPFYITHVIDEKYPILWYEIRILLLLLLILTLLYYCHLFVWMWTTTDHGVCIVLFFPIFPYYIDKRTHHHQLSTDKMNYYFRALNIIGFFLAFFLSVFNYYNTCECVYVLVYGSRWMMIFQAFCDGGANDHIIIYYLRFYSFTAHFIIHIWILSFFFTVSINQLFRIREWLARKGEKNQQIFFYILKQNNLYTNFRTNKFDFIQINRLKHTFE